jgi:hypothetical protein
MNTDQIVSSENLVSTVVFIACLFVAQISHFVSFLPGLVSKIISAFLSDVFLPRVILELNMTKKSYRMNLQMEKSVLSGKCPDNEKALPLTS